MKLQTRPHVEKLMLCYLLEDVRLRHGERGDVGKGHERPRVEKASQLAQNIFCGIFRAAK